MTHPLHIAFIWHMHQPYYRDLVTSACSLPWVRLHAAKDYVDMVRMLEPFPSIHQTVNVVPSLLDQIQEYLPPLNRSDDYLDLSRKPAEALTPQEQRFVLEWFFLAHLDRMIKPHPHYHDLLARRGAHVGEEEWPALCKRFRAQDYLDLQVWFNLVWIDPWLRAQDPRLTALEQRGQQFTEEDKRYVLEQHLALLGQVIPTYRAAAAKGQIELTTSPYYHPILPLLCNIRSAHAALPHLPLPSASFQHPEDARWHLQTGLARHREVFGADAKGVWPPEGSVSEETVSLAMEANVQWIATDEEILWRTLKQPRAASALYRPHLLRRKGRQLAIVFRDRELSDRIGFVYSQWETRGAVQDFLGKLDDIAQQFRTVKVPPLITIILDGENAWEHYPNDGHDFLAGLYEALARDERFRCVTVSEFLERYPLQHDESLPELFSGSWIDGNFATWIGHPEKNSAWAHLAAAREALSPRRRDDPAALAGWKSLGVAQGSDWMWWFGDTHFSAHAEEFDRLFRAHLANSYRLAGLEPPAALAQPIHQRAAPSLSHPTGLIHPIIDGRETSYYEWLYAGVLDLRRQYSAIHRGEQCLLRIAYGFDQANQYLRLDLDRAKLGSDDSWVIELLFSDATRVRIAPDHGTVRAHVTAPVPTAVPCALDRMLEVAVPHALLAPGLGPRIALAVQFVVCGKMVERYPEQGAFELLTAAAEFAASSWTV